MNILKRHKGKSATKVSFDVYVHTLGPVPNVGDVIVRWQRGSRSGASKAVAPSSPSSAQGVQYVVDQMLSVPCTLYQGSTPGSFDRKHLEITIQAARQKQPLGSVVVDLAPYASNASATERLFPVEGAALKSFDCGLLLTISTAHQAPAAPASDGAARGSLPPPMLRSASSATSDISILTDSSAAPSDAHAGRSSAAPSGGATPAGRMSRASPAFAAGMARPSPVPLGDTIPASTRSTPYATHATPSRASPGTVGSARAESASARSSPGAERSASGQLPARARGDGRSLTPPLSATRSRSLTPEAPVEKSSAAGRAEVSAAALPGLARVPAASIPGLAPASSSGSVPRLRDSAPSSTLPTPRHTDIPSSARALPSLEVVPPEAGASPQLSPSHNSFRTPCGSLGAVEAPTPTAWSGGAPSALSSIAGDPTLPLTVRRGGTARRFAQVPSSASQARWRWRGEEGASVQEEAARGSAGEEAASSDAGLGAQAPRRTPSSASRGSYPQLSPRGSGHPPLSPPGYDPPSGAALQRFSASGRGGAGLVPGLGLAGGHASAGDLAPLLLSPHPAAPVSLLAPHSPATSREARQRACARELTLAAALEACVFACPPPRALRAGATPSDWHASSRRLARAMLALGPVQGSALGAAALAAVRRLASGLCLERLAHWWSNIVQLRWMLWAMNQGAMDAGASSPAWGAGRAVAPAPGWGGEGARARRRRRRGTGSGGEEGLAAAAARAASPSSPPAAALAESLLLTEEALFERAVDALWDGTLLPVLLAQGPLERPSESGTVSAPESPPTEESSRAAAGRCLHRWTLALSAAQAALAAAASAPWPDSGTASLLAVLRRTLLVQLLARVDAALLAALLAPGGGGDPLGRGDGGHGGAPFAGAGRERLPAWLLPFDAPGQGVLTCQLGIGIKLGVATLVHWAHDAGLQEAAGRDGPGGLADARLFPLLRGTANLLMMDKEAVLDRGVREEMAPGLSLATTKLVLQQFVPDEFAPDPLPQGLLDALRDDSPRAGDSDGGVEEGYEPPSEEVMLEKGWIESLSLDPGSDSDEELQAMTNMWPDPEMCSRYAHLQTLWGPDAGIDLSPQAL